MEPGMCIFWLIFGYKVLNPYIGAIENAGQESCTVCPPAIDFYIHNIKSGPGRDIFRASRSSLLGTLDEAVAEVGEHVKRGVYSIRSMNASRFSVIVICKTDGSAAEVQRELFTMQEKLVKLQLEKIRPEQARATELSTCSTSSKRKRLQRLITYCLPRLPTELHQPEVDFAKKF
jgi:hypothetical protein